MAPEYIRSLGGKERNKKFEKKSTNEAGKKNNENENENSHSTVGNRQMVPPPRPSLFPLPLLEPNSTELFTPELSMPKKKQKKTNVETKGPVHRERFFLLFFCLNVCVFISRRRIFWP